ncbi:MAG: maleylpyruvate isomerase N-terminal domain-containing protein [Bacteroidota bacterium]
MITNSSKTPIQTLHLFPVLDQMLIGLLKSLTAEEWHAPTIAKLWTVKDIASHLLDGNLRALSYSRDNYFGEKPTHIHSYSDLVAYLNQLNASWTNATKRLSPTVLIELLEATGKQYSDHLQTLDPFGIAVFSVAWAGQDQSQNWFHIAREYTEKFIHQQQIREAVGKQALFTKALFYPFIDTFMFGLPPTYRNVDAKIGTVVSIKVLTDIGGEWNIIKKETEWKLINNPSGKPISTVSMTPEIAWKLFSKGITPEQAFPEIEIKGEKEIGEIALQMVSVMA